MQVCDRISHHGYWLFSLPLPAGGASSGDFHPGIPAVVESPRATMRMVMKARIYQHSLRVEPNLVTVSPRDGDRCSTNDAIIHRLPMGTTDGEE
jgi:hypothetical protein